MKASELIELIEQNYSKRGIERVSQECINSPEKLELLIKLLCEGKGRSAQLASWVLSKVTDLNADLVSSHFESLLKLLNQSTSSSVKRNVIRTFVYISIPQEYHGTLINACFKTLQNRDNSIAERAFSMHVLGNYVKLYSDLSNELIPVIEEGMPYESAAFKSIGRKLLKQMKF
ncbi:MAG: hypothetical protein WED33_07885 [Bacteroidia bacterium]